MATDWTQIYKKYKGLWVALKSDEKTVVGSGVYLKDALKEAQKKGYEEPIVFRVPKELVAFVG